jgi:regulator of telomere elongation helicase 1
VWSNYQSQMSYWLKPYIKVHLLIPSRFFEICLLIFSLQCYSKYGEVVQTLTRFFRDKVSLDPLEPKEMDCNGKDPVLNLEMKLFVCFFHPFNAS